MPVAFPVSPFPWTAKPRLVDFGSDLTPQLGGPAQRVGRLGTRWAVDVMFPSMNGRFAKAMAAARVKARASGSTLLLAWPQPNVVSNYGAPVVSGGGQAGLSLVVTGVSKGEIEAGTFFSFVVSGRNYLHQVTDTIVVPSGGAVTLQIAPMLRVAPPDQTALKFQNPAIEGFVQGAVEDWAYDALLKTSIHSFTIQEVQ